jgi:hypothetical protein
MLTDGAVDDYLFDYFLVFIDRNRSSPLFKMKLTQEQIDQNLAAVAAYFSGKNVQDKLIVSGPESWDRAPYPKWLFSEFVYRPEPEPQPPKYRPWTNEEMNKEVGSIVQNKITKSRALIVSALAGTACLGVSNYDLRSVFGLFERLDGTPCGVMEDSK